MDRSNGVVPIGLQFVDVCNLDACREGQKEIIIKGRRRSMETATVALKYVNIENEIILP